MYSLQPIFFFKLSSVKNLQFELAKTEGLVIVQRLAHEIWPVTFKGILSSEQIDYMLNWMYSITKLESQFDAGHAFYIAKQEGKAIGFTGLEFGFPTKDSLRIHKIYVLPEMHGKGIGKHFMVFIEQLAKEKNLNQLHLNVNRFNNAVDFYKHLGFETILVEDNEIGNGYLMEDYVMVKKLNNL